MIISFLISACLGSESVIDDLIRMVLGSDGVPSYEDGEMTVVLWDCYVVSAAANCCLQLVFCFLLFGFYWSMLILDFILSFGFRVFLVYQVSIAVAGVLSGYVGAFVWLFGFLMYQ
jgi:hypothetical protein